jgi:hypothetical protein
METHEVGSAVVKGTRFHRMAPLLLDPLLVYERNALPSNHCMSLLWDLLWENGLLQI